MVKQAAPAGAPPTGGQRRLPRPGIGLGTTAIPLAVVRLLGMTAEFAAFALLARELGPSGFGTVAVAFILARYLGLVADWGASLGGSRMLTGSAEPDWASIRRLLRWRGLVGAVLAAGFIAVTAAIDPVLVPIGITVACRGLNRDWLSLGRGNGARAGASSVVQGVGLLVAAVLLIDGSSLSRAAWVIALGYIAGAAASISLNRPPARHVASGAGRTETTTTSERAPWVLLIQVADQLLATADTTLIALLASAHAAGIYAAVCRIPNAAITGQGLLVAGLVPGVARRIADGDAATLASLRRASLRVGGAIAGCVLVASPLALWLLPRIFGPRYAEGRFALLVLLLAVAVSAGTVALFPVALGMGRERSIAVGFLVATGVNLVANLIVIRRWSYNGAAVVMLGSQLLIAANYLRTTRSGSR